MMQSEKYKTDLYDRKRENLNECEGTEEREREENTTD